MSVFTKWANFCSSFRCRLFIIFTLLTAGITFFIGAFYISSEIKEKQDLARTEVRLLGRQLAESIRLPLYAGNRDILQQHVEQIAQLPEVQAVEINGTDGKVFAGIRRSAPSRAVETISETVEVYSGSLSGSVEAELTGAQDTTRLLLGSVRIERGLNDMGQAVRRIITVTIATAIGFWLLVTLCSYLILQRLTRSFTALMQGIATLQRGDFAGRIAITGDDEAARAAAAVNELAQALQERTEENSRLQEERLSLERQMLHAQKLESLGVMAGGIAHDFNNLLQSLLGNLELAQWHTIPDASISKYLDNAMKSGKNAARLTGLMLTYVGKGSASKTDLSLNELVNDNADLLNTAITAAVSLELTLAAELPTIRGDRAQLQQVLMNLLANAAEAVEAAVGHVMLATGVQLCDGIDLEASLVEIKPQPGRYVFVEVRDNGCGMDMETLSRIFDPFFSTKFTGRGLGLSAVIGIIRSHHGALFVTSVPGEGTTFRALFPALETAVPLSAFALQQSPSRDIRGVESAAVPVALSGSPLSGVVLVVDDEKPVLKVCEKLVKLCGFTVITACDGSEAVTVFREHQEEITLVLMDLTMPKMDGITAMNEIIAIKPDTRVILSSGFNESELGEHFTTPHHAYAGFIRKPYSMSELEAEIRRVLQEP
jgi:signal transduction histidine kinase/CheY-like chemotaxis protein